MAKESKSGIQHLVERIERVFGRGILMPLDGGAIDGNIAVYPTGSFVLDEALGIGGVPRGRIIEIYGPEASGKTTLALSIIAQAQKQGAVAAIIDAEHALNLKYALDLGCDPSRLLVSQPDCGEQALQVVEALVRTEEVNLIVVDSVAALTPKAEIDGEMGDQAVGMHARLMSKAMRKLAGIAHKSGTTLIFINQMRQKIGVVFGNPEVTTGGNALKFYASVRMDVRRIAGLKRGDEVYGNRIRVKVVKNKLAPPARFAEFDLVFGSGFCREAEVFDRALKDGVITRAGAWYKLDGEMLGQGRDKVVEELLANAALLERIERCCDGTALCEGDAAAAQA